jgi:hypothetical protein
VICICGSLPLRACWEAAENQRLAPRRQVLCREARSRISSARRGLSVLGDVRDLLFLIGLTFS